MDANAYANDDYDDNGQRERDVEWDQNGERGRRGGVSAKWMLSRFGYLFWATAVSAVPSLAITRLSLMAEMAA